MDGRTGKNVFECVCCVVCVCVFVCVSVIDTLNFISITQEGNTITCCATHMRDDDALQGDTIIKKVIILFVYI